MKDFDLATFEARVRSEFFVAQADVIREYRAARRPGESGNVDIEFEGYELIVFIATNTGRRIERRVKLFATVH